MPFTLSLLVNFLSEILVPLIVTFVVLLLSGQLEELAPRQRLEGIILITMAVIGGNMLYTAVIRPILTTVLFLVILFCPLWCLVDAFLHIATMYAFVVAVCEYVLDIHLEGSYDLAGKIVVATIVIWFVMSLVGFAVFMSAPLVL